MIPDGYKFNYTWWSDFDIADHFGLKAVKDTYTRAFREWRRDCTAMKELTAVLNWRCWKHYEEKREDFSKLYRDLYEECYSKCLDYFKGDELTEYWSFLD